MIRRRGVFSGRRLALVLALAGGACGGPARAQAPSPNETDLSWAWAECKAGTFDLRELGPKGKYPPPGRFAILTGDRGDAAIPYFACLSLIPGRENSCDLISIPGGFPPADLMPRRRCMELRHFVETAGAALGNSGNALAACRTYLQIIGLKTRAADGDGPCQSWTRALKDGNVSAFCSRGAALGLVTPEEQDGCPALFAAFEGSPARCRKGAAPFCVETAGLLGALRSGNKGECRAIPFCDAVSYRMAGACEPFREHAQKTICEGFSAAQAVVKKKRPEKAGTTPEPPTEKDKESVKAILAKEQALRDVYRKSKTDADVAEARRKEAEKIAAAQAARQAKEAAKKGERQFKQGEPMQRPVLVPGSPETAPAPPRPGAVEEGRK